MYDGDSLRRQLRLTHEHSSDFETNCPHTHKFTHKGTRAPDRCRLFREERLSEASRLDMSLVDVRPPVWPDISTDHAAPGADHPRAERPHDRIVGQPVGIHERAVVGIGRSRSIGAGLGSHRT
jgi:hypothetical protein